MRNEEGGICDILGQSAGGAVNGCEIEGCVGGEGWKENAGRKDNAELLFFTNLLACVELRLSRLRLLTLSLWKILPSKVSLLCCRKFY